MNQWWHEADWVFAVGESGIDLRTTKWYACTDYEYKIKARPLSETLFSQNRRAILGLLYGHPDQEFYLRQMVRASGGGHGAVQLELKHLSEAGILLAQFAAAKSISGRIASAQSSRNSRPSSSRRRGWRTFANGLDASGRADQGCLRLRFSGQGPTKGWQRRGRARDRQRGVS